jgi:cytochrome P450
MKEVGFGGDTYKGSYLPAGTRVGHNTWSITHDKGMFGEDADQFRPERWLEVDDGKRNIMKRQTQLVFGSGRWECAGKAVAFMELHKLFVEVSCSAMCGFSLNAFCKQYEFDTDYICSVS